MIRKITDKLSSPRNESRLVGFWPSGTDEKSGVPIYHVDTFHDFNRIVGYAKFVNSSFGTVLYRGQTKDHGSLVPSGAREGKKAISASVIDNICKDQLLYKFFQLSNSNIDGWKEYQKVIIESVIQHYGGNTYCMDFVDNHWCALWFGANQFENGHYYCRADDDGYLYIFLYLADTNGSSVRGMYIGEDTYTVDLRKALPSTFQRPAAQHGWIVRKKNTSNDCNYDERVIGVIEITVNQAKKWLGNGGLLSEENFFPSFDIDQGYNVLLQRQLRSGLSTTAPVILPANTICNYHISQTYYCSNRTATTQPVKELRANGKIINSVEELYSILLEKGWQENTCTNAANWEKTKPWAFQSAPTALLVQRYFGGEIYMRNCLHRPHYYNVIDSIVIDLTSQEMVDIEKSVLYSKGINLGNTPQNTMRNNSKFLNNLFVNCQIDDKVAVVKRNARNNPIQIAIYRDV